MKLPETGAPPLSAPPPFFLHRALQLTLVTLAMAVSLLYPLKLSESRLELLYAYFDPRLWATQILPWLSGGITPLLAKECALLTLLIPVIALFIGLKIRGQMLGTETSALGPDKSWRALIRKPELWAFAFIIYTGFTLAWSATFQQSLQTWALLTSGILLAVVIRSEIIGTRFAVRFMGIIVLCGIAVAVIALLQHLDRGSFIPHNPDPRNRMSSLIGHNTGMSGWLLFPFAFALYFLFHNGRLSVKLLCAATLALFALVILAAQSRAVWALGLFLALTLCWQFTKIQARRLRLKALLIPLALLLAIIAGLSISPQTNPLARLPVTLQQRITGDILNLDQLRRETRLRILVVSLAKLFPRAPLQGTGLGTFPWEYPKAQGEYFQRHPESRLGTTLRRTDIAHNDYLQLLVETGLIGLALFAGLAFSLAAELRRQYRALASDPWLRARFLALTSPAAAIALHAFVDFPMHVAPIACLAIFSLSLATRLTPEPAPLPLAPRAPRRVSLLSGAIAFAIIIAACWPWRAFVGRPLTSDVYFNQGLHWLDEYQAADAQPGSRQLACLDRARRYFREAIVRNVFNGEAYEGQLTAIVNRMELQTQQYLATDPADADSSTSQLMRQAIATDFDQVTSMTEAQLAAGGPRYHYTYYLLGRAWRRRWDVESHDGLANPYKARSYLEAEKQFQQALAFNPADAASLRELSDLYLQNPATAEQGRALERRLFDIDPWTADALLLKPAIRRAQLGELELAESMLKDIFESQSAHPQVLAARAWLAYYKAVWPPAELDRLDNNEKYTAYRKAELDKGYDALTHLPAESPYLETRDRLELLYAAASGDAPRSFTLAKAAVDRNMWDREARAIWYWADHHLHGGVLKFENSLEYYHACNLLCLYFLPPREYGLSLAELTLRPGLPEDQKITQPEARRLIAFCQANPSDKMTDLLRQILPVLRDRFPGDPTLHAALIRIQ